MTEAQWTDVGDAEQLRRMSLPQVMLGRTQIALVYKDGVFSAISGACNHVGGPLAEGRLDGDYVVCPWHYWKFHCRTGEGEPGYEAVRRRRDERAGRGVVQSVPRWRADAGAACQPTVAPSPLKPDRDVPASGAAARGWLRRRSRSHRQHCQRHRRCPMRAALYARVSRLDQEPAGPSYAATLTSASPALRLVPSQP
ncbi:MAG: Rieske (2Fe-2S) protein [Acidobacteria bacterium]|nr:Rieske (2Fe-2S) protein [Acidobacteriota bacterium]